MKTRIISALIMLPLLLFLYFGGIPLLCITFLMSLIAMSELYKGFESIDIHPIKWMGYVSLVCLYAIIVWGEFLVNEQKVYAHLLCMWIVGNVLMGLLITLFRKGNPIADGTITSLAALYIGFFLCHIPLISRISKYDKMVWIVFLCAFGADIFAYFTGYFFGKHKLCPEISPKKTVEGAIGGVLGSMLLCGIFGYFIYPDEFLHCLIIGAFGSVFSMLGDLIASVFKRKMGIKDYGNLIPGHGGVLDRFDSVIFTAPFVYYYILVIMRP